MSQWRIGEQFPETETLSLQAYHSIVYASKCTFKTHSIWAVHVTPSFPTLLYYYPL